MRWALMLLTVSLTACKDGNITEVQAGLFDVVARHSDGHLSEWHRDDAWKSDRTPAERAEIRAMRRPPSGEVSAYSIGDGVDCAVVDGKASCWGYGADAVNLSGVGGLTAVECNLGYCCFWKADESLICAGDAYLDSWQFPDATNSVALKQDEVMRLGSDGVLQCEANSGWVDLPCGTAEWEGVPYVKLSGKGLTCLLLEDGSALCWWDRDEPHDYPGPYEDISVGDTHFCGLFADQHVECEGFDERSDVTPPDDVKFLQVSAGWGNSCGTTTDNRAVCWGKGVPEVLLE